MPRELTREEREAGYHRVDPDTNEPLRKGWMSRAELRAHWKAQAWRKWAFGPKPGEEFVWTETCGWVRRKPETKR